ncbi:MAG: phosphate ABC transporter ATP-binding protein PstB [Aequoribacter sp.]|jgi:phosphate transport system ATP-binding protein|uniref:Phosphate transport ATP-binding protein PstB (TC 3.A.1.7.1) n=1 Tax=Aequoribacter fuscus TaxID=2518989 RepID=F3L4T2_9GAMM|nr:phosphate ABC transporter ATP-binding protein PstB [Aequoribacter fuscus]EGG28666.1 Phosphate transport ATP-binding protein PstB (TC 3.A.1.7.1) [Aequoribacter fuscus]QHJ88123.1 phosphate ABC transporter ATP-binding protein [Aequoribacter fuscus]
MSQPIIEIKDLALSYGPGRAVLNNVQLSLERNAVTAIIGASGSGKSSLLRCLNRLVELTPKVRITGDILFEGESIFGARIDPTVLRQRIGMVFQKPNPFPMSIFENVAYGLRLLGEKSPRVLQEKVEQALIAAALWDEVRDRLDVQAAVLSGGQQQRLVIARAIAVEPEVLLLDEPASSLDPISTLRIEELIYRLKQNFTIVVVTHNMQQAARVSDWAAFMHDGTIVEYDNTTTLFTNPREVRTEDYITGRFG